MTGRGRRAVQAPVDFVVEVAPMSEDGLQVTVVNKEGHPKVFDFSTLSVPEAMQRSLAGVFVAQSPQWNSHTSADATWYLLTVFVRFLSELERPVADLSELDVVTLKRWRLQVIGTNTGRTALRAVYRMLRADPRLADGVVAEELARRIPAPVPVRESYDEEQRARVVGLARRQFRAAQLRIAENTEHLERWRAAQLVEGSREARLGEQLDYLARTGNVPRTLLPGGRRVVTNQTVLGGRSEEKSWGRLFLRRGELVALAVLLTDRFGWNLSVYDRLPAPTRAPSTGEGHQATYQVRIEKRRAGNGRWFSTENITDTGADSPGRLITQALAATRCGRLLAADMQPGTDYLMTAHNSGPVKVAKDRDRPRPIDPLVFGVSALDAYSWAKKHDLDSSPFRRLRRTTVTREGKPLQHAPGTHESVYMVPDTRVQEASRTVFADGAYEVLQQAQHTVFGGTLTPAANPLHGHSATTDCADERTSPWPSPEGGCGADFLLCLACPNAHVHPGHHPRLALLHQQITELRTVLPEPSWQRRWQDPWSRLEDLAGKVGTTTWRTAAGHVSDTDRAMVDLLVKGHLAP